MTKYGRGGAGERPPQPWCVPAVSPAPGAKPEQHPGQYTPTDST